MNVAESDLRRHLVAGLSLKRTVHVWPLLHNGLDIRLDELEMVIWGGRSAYTSGLSPGHTREGSAAVDGNNNLPRSALVIGLSETLQRHVEGCR